MFVGLTCPRCSQPLKLPEERLGALVRCPSCRERFTFEASSLSDEPAGALSETRLRALRTARLGRVQQASSRLRDRTADWIGLQSHVGKGATDVSILLSGLAALALTVVLYLGVFLPFRTPLIEALFLVGWVPKAIVFLSSWSLCILAWKFLKIRRLQASLLYDALPREISAEIRPDNAARFRDQLLALPVASAGSYLINRVLRALDHVRSGRDAQEVSALLNSQSELDSMAVESSYTMLKAFIWAVPILGFIGTVLGIGQSVLAFSDTLDQAQSIDVIRSSLGGVTSGLAFAFNTTLIALAASILLMLPTHWLQKLEDDLLNSVSDYCNEELLGRLEADASVERDGAAEMVRVAMASALEHQSAALEAWSERLARIGATLTGDVAAGLTKVEGELQETYRARAGTFADSMAAAVDHSQKELQALMAGLQAASVALQQETTQRVEELIGRIADSGRETTREVQETLTRALSSQEQALGQLGPAQERQARSLGEMLTKVEGTIERVQQGLSGLHDQHTQGLERLARTLEESMRSLAERGSESWARAEQALADRHRSQSELLSGSVGQVVERAQQSLEQLLRRQQEGTAALQQETSARVNELLAGLGETGRSGMRDLTESLGRTASATETQQRMLADALTRVDASVGELQKNLVALQQRHAEGLERLTRGLADGLGALQERGEREARSRASELEESSAALRRGMGELEKRAGELAAQVGRLTPALEQQTGRLSGQLAGLARDQLEALGRSSSQITGDLRGVAESLEHAATTQTGRLQDSVEALRELQGELSRTLPESLAAQRAALESSREQCDRLVETQRRLADNLDAIRTDEALRGSLSELGGLASALGRDIEALQRRASEVESGRHGFRLPFFKRGTART